MGNALYQQDQPLCKQHGHDFFQSGVISRFITFNSEAASRKRIHVYFLQGVCHPGEGCTGKCRALRCSRFFRDGVKLSFKHGIYNQGHLRMHSVHMLDLQWLKLGFSHVWIGYRMGKQLQFILRPILLGCNGNTEAIKAVKQLLRIVLMVLFLRANKKLIM